MEKGRIIFLNGVSSAGKSTLAKRLQEKLTEPYYYIAQDTFTQIVTPCFKGKFDGEKLNALWLEAVSAMHHTIKLYSDLGYHVIVDHVLTDFTDADGQSDRSLEECVRLLFDYPVLFVKVVCSVEELRRREAERGDRAPGTAEWQLQYLAPADTYDLVVNTSTYSTDACADSIMDFIKTKNRYQAFQQIYLEMQ